MGFPSGDLPPGGGRFIDGRFTLLGLVAQGGMGAVYRARDGQSGEAVAIKILRPGLAESLAARFFQEAKLLSELRHPGIVRYVAHGKTGDGEPYLAMALLDGEDLAARLSRGSLTAAESLRLLTTAAEALTVAHRLGIVHRDLKPSNLFLPQGDVERVVLLDFGIAHRPQQVAQRPLTQTGMVIGTPEYMAPEQARGEHGIGPSADIFSLGAILFECLTGEAPFAGAHLPAVLAKVLFAELPSLCQLRPELPVALEELLSRMLKKDPSARLPDADALLLALRAVGPLPELLPQPRRQQARPVALTQEEQQFVCALAAAVPVGATGPAATRTPESLTADLAARPAGLEHALLRLGAQVAWLPGGTLVCSLAQLGEVADQARQAGRAALVVGNAWPEALVAIATGEGQRSQQSGLPIGAALDRVMRLLGSAGRDSTPGSRIFLDELTTRFLDARFRAEPRPGGLYSLVGLSEPHEHEHEHELGHKLLGRPMPFVGREQELSTLLAAHRTCVEESVSRVLLVTAAAGSGKSRLRKELLQRLASQGDGLHRLAAQAEPEGGGLTGGLLGQALAGAGGLREADSVEQRWLALRRYTSAHVPESERAHATAFLGELCGLPVPDSAHPMLATARLSPQIRDEQLSLAVLSLLRALSQERPTLVVLEDLQWGDEQTLRWLDLALRELAEQPLLVLAFARPEVHEVFPRLWSERNVQELRLQPLGKRACERLIQSALGETLDSAVRQRIISQSAGNALFLEELIRAQAEGEGSAVPATVLAVLQARLLRLPSAMRRVLRAASVLGASCTRAGIAAILGVRGNAPGSVVEDEAAVDAGLQALVRAELLERRAHSRFAEQPEYGWRHALMQQAAYSLLTESDRVHAHARAAAFLMGLAIDEPAELAGHLERGGDPQAALPHYIQAAQRSYEQFDLSAVLRYTERAIACGSSAPPAALGLAFALRCATHRYLGQHTAVVETAERALPLLPRGSGWWFRTLFQLSLPLRLRGELGRAADLAEQWAGSEPEPDAEATYIEIGAWFTVIFSQMAEPRTAVCMWQRLTEFASRQSNHPLYLQGMITYAHAEYSRAFTADPWWQLEAGRTAAELLGRSGGQREACAALIYAGQARTEVGDVDQGIAELRACVELTARLQQPYLVVIAKGHLMAALSLRASSSAAAAALARELLQEAAAGPGFQGWSHLVLAQDCMRRDAHSDAEKHLSQAIALSGGNPLRRLHAQSLRILLLLRAGEAATARQLAEQLAAEATARGGGGHCATAIGLAVARALHAAGDIAGAQAQLRATVAALERRASRIPDAAVRERYLRELPDHRVALGSDPLLARLPD